MLIEFRVANHRSVRDEQALTMEAGRSDLDDARLRRVEGANKPLLTVAVLYGANASGKSNVLDALHFMREAVLSSHRFWPPESAVPRDAFAWGPSTSKPSIFEVTIIRLGVRYQYGFCVDDDRVLEEWLYAWPNHHKQTWFHRELDTFDFSEHFHGENKVIVEITRPNSLFLSAATQNRHAQATEVYAWFRELQPLNMPRIQWAFPVRSSSSAAHRPMRGRPGARPENGNERLMRMLEIESSAQLTLFDDDSENSFKSRFLNLLKHADLGILDFKVIRNDERGRPTIYFKHQTEVDDAWLPFDHESRGTQTLIDSSFSFFTALEQGSTIFVDELESSLHPLLAKKIVSEFNDPKMNPKNAQLIFTTHDTNLLGSMADEPALRRDQVWLTEKDDQGATVLYPLSDYKPRKAENLERGYLEGRFGAVPFLGNFRLSGE